MSQIETSGSGVKGRTAAAGGETKVKPDQARKSKKRKKNPVPPSPLGDNLNA